MGSLKIDDSNSWPGGIRQQCPERDQPPSHDGQLPLPRLAVESHHRLQALRRDIVGRCERGIIEHIGVVRLHPFGDPLLVCAPAVSSTHGERLTPGPGESGSRSGTALRHSAAIRMSMLNQ